MARSVWSLLLCGVFLCGSLTFAATRRPAPTRVESEYTLSLRVSDSDIWLGAPAQLYTADVACIDTTRGRVG